MSIIIFDSLSRQTSSLQALLPHMKHREHGSGRRMDVPSTIVNHWLYDILVTSCCILLNWNGIGMEETHVEIDVSVASKEGTGHTCPQLWTHFSDSITTQMSTALKSMKGLHLTFMSVC